MISRRRFITGFVMASTPLGATATAQEYKAQQAGQPVAIKVYPGAHHSFDSDRPQLFRADRVNTNAPGGRGATTGGNPQAWEDSIREVVALFAWHLKDG